MSPFPLTETIPRHLVSYPIDCKISAVAFGTCISTRAEDNNNLSSDTVEWDTLIARQWLL